MNGITILIWITIAITAIIAIIAVKLYFKGHELEHEEGSILPSAESINGTISKGRNIINTNSNNSSSNARRSLSPQSRQRPQHNLFRNTETQSGNDAYIVPEVEENNLTNYEYESENQVLINYDNTVEKFQEPIKESQMDIMTQNNNNNKDEDASELKDLFTIDELIKESKRKDSEREKESQKIEIEEDDAEIDELKESIKNKNEEPLIEEVISEDKEETIGDLINDSSKTEETSAAETPSVASKDVDEEVTTPSEESASDATIKDDLSNKESEKEASTEKISEPSLKTPKKVNKSDDYKMGASIDDAALFDDGEEDGMDLDYRKDLNKFTNKIKGSKLFKEVKGKLTPESAEFSEEEPESYIRNVNEYDEYEPIVNETHIDYEASYDEYHDISNDQRLRQENTRRVFKNKKPLRTAQSGIGEIKNKPSRDNIKIILNNSETVLRKGDEIIFNHMGESYSSQVYAINGDDISVKYRRKNIKIKPSDVKKIY